ncbi:MAG: hypothetical protein V3T70_09290, partial [Phycisphaerae bacterium]
LIASVLFVPASGRAFAQSPESPPAVSASVDSTSFGSPVAEEWAPRLEHAARVFHPHGYGFDFAKRGDFVFFTKRESGRKFGVLDVSDPTHIRLVADIPLPHYRSDDICLYGDFALVDCWGRIVPVDISEPRRPRPRLDLTWRPDTDRKSRMPFYEMAVRDDLLFVAMHDPERALRIYRIEPPFRPVLLATVDVARFMTPRQREMLQIKFNGGLRHTQRVVPANSRIHVATGAFVLGVDVADAANPRLVYVLNPKTYVEDIAVAGNRLFVATSNRGRPGRKSGEREPLPSGSDLGILMYELSASGLPTMKSAYNGMPIPQRLLLRDGHLIAVGSEPCESGTVYIGGAAISDSLREGYFTQRTVLQVIAWSGFQNARPVGRYVFPPQYGRPPQMSITSCRALLAEGSRLYVGLHGYGLACLDLSDPATPRLLSMRCTATSESSGVVLCGSRAWICTGRRLIPADSATTDNPVCRVEDALSLPPLKISVGQPIAAANAGIYHQALMRPSPSLATYRLPESGPAELIGLSELADGFEARCLLESSDHVFALIVGSNRRDFRLRIYDVSNDHRQLTPVSECPVARLRRGVGAYGSTEFWVNHDRAVVIIKAGTPEGAGGAVLIVIDVSRPDRPRILGRGIVPLNTPGTWRPGSRFFDDNHLYVFGGTFKGNTPSVSVVDAQDPSRPIIVGRLIEKPGAWYTDLTVLEPHALLAVQDYRFGLRLIDVRDPSTPRIVWTETPVRPDETPYAAMGWSAGVFWQDRLYVPRLDHLDIFRVVAGDGAVPPD